MNTYTGYSISRAVKAFFNGYCDFKGRSTASAYWMVQLVLFLIGLAIGILAALVGTIDAVSIAVGIWGLFTLAIILPSIALTVRRLHDTGKSGWFFLISLIPYVGGIAIIVLCCMDSQKGTNQWGPSEKYPDAE